VVLRVGCVDHVCWVISKVLWVGWGVCVGCVTIGAGVCVIGCVVWCGAVPCCILDCSIV
jgi:hypothetical protein